MQIIFPLGKFNLYQVSLGGHVKKQTIARTVSALMFACCSVGFSNAWAAEQTIDECSKELLLAYFPEPFVKDSLKKFQVPEEQWELIQKELASKDKEVIKIVEQKASQMDPNPLKDPQARQTAVKLFRDTLLQIFSDVMKAHGITDEKQIQEMLDHVQQQKAQRFAKCMQKENQSNPPSNRAEDQ